MLLTTGNIIRKKEYMNRRDLSEVTIPPNVTEIESWAFAYCDHLTKIYIPTSVQAIGTDIFEGCTALRDIIAYENGHSYETLSRLVVIAFTYFHQPALLSLTRVGTPDWIAMWDTTMLSYLRQADNEGFRPFLAGGEEDYEDKNSNLDYFCHMRRMQKVSCCIERLLIEQQHPLESSVQRELVDYLTMHSHWNTASDTPAETIDVLLCEEEKLFSLFQFYEAQNLLAHICIPDLIAALSSEQVELKALLMGHMQRFGEGNDPWDSFRL